MEARATQRRIRGLDFAFLEWGESEGPPLLLLHGWQDQAGIWLRFAEQLLLRRSARILAMDLRGFGASAHSHPGSAYAFAEYLVDLDQLLDQLPGPVTLIGHSMGGTIASLYAGLRPERISGLVIVDGLGIPDGLEGVVQRMREHLDGMKQTMFQRSFPSLEEVAARLTRANPALDPPHALFMAQRAAVQDSSGWQWRWDPRHRVRLAVPYRQDQHLRVLAEVTAPTLLVLPERVTFEEKSLESLSGAIRGLQRVQLPGCGHMLHVELPADLAEVVHHFLPPPQDQPLLQEKREY